MRHLGDFAEDSTVLGSFNTRKADGTPITLAGSPTLAVYKGNSVTEITTGITLTVNFDSRTGLHLFAIDTSADAAYTTGSDYRVVITAGTVDAVSVVGTEVASFSLANRYAAPVSLGAAAPSGWINAAAIASNAITSAKIAASAIGATQIASNAITDAKIASNAITSAKIAANAIGATQIAASALNGKGNWNVGKTGYSLTATTGLGNQTATITGNVTGSVGSVTGAVGSVTSPVTLAAADVRSAIGMASANLDTQLSGINSKTTNLPASPAAVGSAMTLANSAITAASIAASALDGKGNWNIGKTGYSLSQAFPANFASLGINSSGHVSRVTLVDTTTTNTDVVGVLRVGQSYTHTNDVTSEASIVTIIVTP